MNDNKTSLAVKVHRVGNNIMVAVCDPDCFNRVLSGPRGTRISIQAPFFGQEQMEAQDLLGYLKVANCYNFVGSRSVDFALAKGIGNQESVMDLGGVPCLMVMKV